jgi:hypothetical protein
MMTNALSLYINHCEDEFRKGNVSLNSMKIIAIQVRSQLHESIEKTSDNYLFEDNCRNK